ncbi:MAG: hypothetical protein R3E32_27080 [Chitinophagales bacterium]
MKKTIFTLIALLASFSVFAQKNLNVYVFLAEECPISIYMAQPLRIAVEQFGENATFYAVFPSAKSTQATASQFLQKYELPQFEVKLDIDQSFAAKLGATITPEVAITDSQTKDLLYRGRISNAYAALGRMRHGQRINDLVNMLTRITQGEKITPPWLPAIGCFITFNQ